MSNEQIKFYSPEANARMFSENCALRPGDEYVDYCYYPTITVFDAWKYQLVAADVRIVRQVIHDILDREMFMPILDIKQKDDTYIVHTGATVSSGVPYDFGHGGEMILRGEDRLMIIPETPTEWALVGAFVRQEHKLWDLEYPNHD